MGYNKNLGLLAVRIMFLIQFYQIGYLYKIKLEEKDKLNNIIYFMIIFIIQYILIFKYNDLRFVIFSGEFNNENIMLAFITSILGILLWLRIAKILVPSLKDSFITNYISNNSWDIMMHHQFIFFIINLIIVNISYKINLLDFDIEMFKRLDWFKYNPKNNGFTLLYCFLGISVPLILKYYLEKIRKNKKSNNISEKAKIL